MQLPHLAARLYGTPLLIARTKLDVILSVLGSRIGWPELGTALPAPAAPKASASVPSGIAVIPVHGTLVRRSMGVDAASGLLSYAEIGASLQAALADRSVQGILLDLDSPGGETGGCFELARQVRAASLVKPVWALANDSAFSAAYAIGCAAERLVLSETGGVGSIGVIALHVDQSAKDAQDGYRYTAITAGAHKNDFSPHTALSVDASAALQAEVDRLYGLFVQQVAAHRGLSAAQVRGTEAALYFGAQAVEAGLADALASPQQVLAEFSETLAARRRLAQPGATRALHPLPPARASPAAHPEPLSSPNPHPLSAEQATMTDENHTPSTEAQTAPAGAPPLDASAASTQARHEAQAIAELCLIAGSAQRTAEFLSSGMSEAQVRRALLEARANQVEIASRITADATVTPSAEHSPVIAAVQKLIKKG